MVTGRCGTDARTAYRILTTLAALALAASWVQAGPLRGRPPQGFDETMGLAADKTAKDYAVQEIACSGPANVFWPGDQVQFAFQFSNRTDKPLKAKGRVEIISYGTATSVGDVFELSYFKIKDVGAVPIEVDMAARGWQDVVVRPPLPERFGAYALVVELDGLGRQFGAACVRVPEPEPGRVQYPSYALDLQYGTQEMAAMFRRLGIKGCRIELGYTPTTSRDFYQRFADLAGMMRVLKDGDITVMITVGATSDTSIMPLGHWRPHLEDDGTFKDGKADGSWLPQYDPDFQEFNRIVASAFGWPRGPVNAMELWNEPWEGLSISGWGSDMLRYRELYERMAMGIEQARNQFGVQVLMGGCCSSMNTLDKLFPDGKDTFLTWLDFTSIHYQPMGAVPALIPEWVNRKGRFGAVKVWDTESWMANSEDRVAAVIASMRSQGQTRTAGVFHDAVRDVMNVRYQSPAGLQQTQIIQVWAPAAAIGAVQKFIGERTFRELLFKDGLPWIYVFNGGLRAGRPDPDDGTVVVVGDLAGVYSHDYMLFRNVKGLKEIEDAPKIAELKRQIAELPAGAPRDQRKVLESRLRELTILRGASLTIDDGGGAFFLADFYGNPLPSKDGTIVIPLDGLGYFLRTSGARGSFDRLLAALRTGRIDGYEPLDVAARDMLAPIGTGPTIRLTLSNILNRPVSGKLTVKVAGLTVAPADQNLSFKPHETRDVDIRVTGGAARPDNTYPLTLVFDAGADGRVLHEEGMHVNLIAKRSIKVDGDLADWKEVLPQPVRSSQAGPGAALTEKAWFPFEKFDEKIGQGVATGYLAWDANFFYFAAKIADSTPYDGNIRFATRDDDQYFYPEISYYVERDPKSKAIIKKIPLTWPQGVRRSTYRKWPDLPSAMNTDNVQIAFNVIPIGQDGWLPNPPGTMPRYMCYRDSDYEYALNQVAEQFGGGTEIWRMFAPGVPRKHFYPRQPKADRDGGAVEGGQLVMRRDGNTRIVEAALPWSELPDVKKRLDAGQTVKFSFRVNDNRGPEMELAADRSVSKLNNYAFHNDWMQAWANEVEFAFEQ